MIPNLLTIIVPFTIVDGGEKGKVEGDKNASRDDEYISPLAMQLSEMGFPGRQSFAPMCTIFTHLL